MHGTNKRRWSYDSKMPLSVGWRNDYQQKGLITFLSPWFQVLLNEKHTNKLTNCTKKLETQSLLLVVNLCFLGYNLIS